MIKKLELNEDFVREHWTEKYQKEVIGKLTDTCSDFKNVPCYVAQWLDMYLCCFKGYEYLKGKPQVHPVDYGYGLTPESLEIYLKSKYPDSDEDIYVVGVSLMSMDYDKYYRNGSFVDLNGVNTGQDFYEMENSDELEKKAYIEDHWITYCVYKMPDLEK